MVRWVAGDAVTKDTLSSAESVKYEKLLEEMEEHFAERFKVQGRIQTYFQFCEASKGITDLYVGHAVPYLLIKDVWSCFLICCVKEEMTKISCPNNGET